MVQRVLIDAQRSGRQFRVIVVDSRPKMEGRHMLRTLVQRGVKCSYVLINAVSYIMKEVSAVVECNHPLRQGHLLQLHANTLVYYFTSEMRTTSLPGTKLLPQIVPCSEVPLLLRMQLFGGVCSSLMLYLSPSLCSHSFSLPPVWYVH